MNSNKLPYYVTVTSGMSGFFAVLVDPNEFGGEPVQTGCGRYEKREDAEQEGRAWANDEQLEFR